MTEPTDPGGGDDHAGDDPAGDGGQAGSDGPGESAPSTAPLVELRGVGVRYGGVAALEAVDLAVGPGLHALVGPNGSGKTTLVYLVLGLGRPTTGTVDRVDELDVGCAFQASAFYPGLTVRENLDVFGALSGGDDPDWRRKVVETLRLDRVRDRRAGDLSGGFARKLDLALALLNRPELLVLDEPLRDVDDVTVERLVPLVEAYADDHAVLVSTHNLDAWPGLERLTVLVDGRVVADRPDPPERGRRQRWYVERVLDAEGATEGVTVLEATATGGERRAPGESHDTGEERDPDAGVDSQD
jgi:ABC-2 type transport system ATP-binding protein